MCRLVGFNDINLNLNPFNAEFGLVTLYTSGIKCIVLYSCNIEFHWQRFEEQCAASSTFGIKVSLNYFHFLVDSEEVANFNYTLQHV